MADITLAALQSSSAVRMQPEKNPLKVSSSWGTPQFLVPLSESPELFGAKTAIYFKWL